jgi:glucose/arabinose dehydrogenase
MLRIVAPLAAFLALVPAAPAQERALPKPLVTGLKNPRSVVVGPDGRIYITVAGDLNKADDGAVMVIENGQAKPFATGLDSPKGMAAFKDWLFVAGNKGVWRIDRTGKATMYAAAEAFPVSPKLLQGLAVDEQGRLFVNDTGDAGGGTAVYRIDPNRKVSVVVDAKRAPALKFPVGLAIDGNSHLLAVNLDGELYRIRWTDGIVSKVADGFECCFGVAYDKFGRLFISVYGMKGPNNRVVAIPRPGEKPVVLASGFQAPAGICLDPTGKSVLVADATAGTLTAIPITIPGWEVDDTPLPLETEVAFPNLQWTGWKSENERGQPTPLRPLVLTHAGDGSHRVFLATQHGVIHVFPEDQTAGPTRVFLDISSKVKYDDRSNEEGFLGLAFHPDYKKNGEFYIFYSIKTQPPKFTNVLCRYRVSKDDPNRADPDSEEELLRVEHPFWNHDGGTVLFGPDGYLYVALGDGGAANDPFGNGQNLNSLLAKVLRIDVNRKENGKPYGIPKDNPFVGRSDARPEIWCYGLRNVWRMAFDRQTGVLWASDVGQDLYEEIDLLVPGGNYGWNLREALHPFGAKGVGPRPDLIDPIWEYHHDVGKSLTGGTVYRGRRLPGLVGSYVYADYVSGAIWGLRYDAEKRRVVANRPIRDRKLPIMSFGEDESGEVYLLTYAANGQGIYRFTPVEPGKK